MTGNIVLREGFDTYNGFSAPEGLLGKWTGSSLQSSFVAGRFGGQALQKTSWSNSASTRLRRTINMAGSYEFTVGMAFQFTTMMVVDNDKPDLWRIGCVDGNCHVALRLGADGSLLALRSSNNVLLGRTPAWALSPNSWAYIEVEGLVDDTVGYFRVYLNGNSIPALSLAGIDTKFTTASPELTHFEVGPLDGNALPTSMIFDDIYMKDAAARLGPRRISTLRVTGNGAIQDWTASTGVDHAACIDETLATTVDYISSSTVGQVDQFTFENLSYNPVTIDEVNLVTVMGKTDGGTRAVTPSLISGATTDALPETFLPTGFARYDYPVALNPDGDTAWDTAAVNALGTQVEVTV